jgi:signal transduction histidine kinase
MGIDTQEHGLQPSGSIESPDLSSTDLAELMAAFTEVTTKLEKTHSQLRSEVGRLNTELHQANEALQRSRRLAALGEMAAGISHEIRNPLGSIRLYANMLVDDLTEMPEQQEIVQKIGRAVRGLDEIVGDVLTFAREMKVSLFPCELSSLIDHAVDMCCAEVECPVIRNDLDADSIELVCDPTLIQQALVNVLRNAGEANRVAGGQQIVIDVRHQQVEQGDDRISGVAISIRDAGDGMPDEVIERMFNPFFTTRDTGTGLGLAIVHRIIDAHGGKVEVMNNEPGDDGCRGATVELYIPKAPPLVVSTHKQVHGAGEIVVRSQRAAVHSYGVD